MATEPTAAKKPAAKTTTRKKTTKRGPTKATALKALGLTKEDLDLLKELKTARENAQAERERSSELQTATTPPGDYYVQNEVEPEIEPSVLAPVPADAPSQAGGAFYVRNRLDIENNFRLERQFGQGKKRFELKPRGQRGDLKKLNEGDLEDDRLITNVELGTIEIITAAEAKDVLGKQTINAQTAIHPAMAALRNELGEGYEQENIKIDPEYNSQGITVAHLNPVGGEFGEIQFDKGTKGFNRGAEGLKSNRTLGGNPHIISDGFARNDSAAQADAVARRKDLQGPEAGLGGVRVTVAPTERS